MVMSRKVAITGLLLCALTIQAAACEDGDTLACKTIRGQNGLRSCIGGKWTSCQASCPSS